MKDKIGGQPGTLALMILKTLDVRGPLHGYGSARREAGCDMMRGDARRGTAPSRAVRTGGGVS